MFYVTARVDENKEKPLNVTMSYEIWTEIRCKLPQSGFGGAEVACWPLIPKFAGSDPAEVVGFLKGDKNPHHAFLRKGSKIIGPMSQICRMLKDPGYISQASSGSHFRP
jgi:hypothetical protein